MAEHGAREPEPEAEETLAGSSPAAFEIAMASAKGGKLPPESAAFLAKQSRLLDLQAEHLHEQRELQLSHLKVRRWHDRMSLVLQALAVVIGLAVAIALAVMVWQARQDRGLVIEAFSVPPDMAARGLNGQVVASQLVDKLAAMQSRTDSGRPARSYQNNWGDDLKVEIPETGVSLSDLNRGLRQWLGRQTRISGEVFRGAQGITVSVRAGDDGAVSYSGAETDLEGLLQQAAAAVYQRTQPYRYAVWLLQQGREDEAVAALTALADGPAGDDRTWGASVLSSVLLNRGDISGATERAQDAVLGDPEDPHALQELGNLYGALGNDGEAADAYQKAGALLARHPGAVTSTAQAMTMLGAKAVVAEAYGDYQASAVALAAAARLPEYFGNGAAARVQVAADLAWAHDAAGADRVLARARRAGADASLILETQILADQALGRWGDAQQALKDLRPLAEKAPGYRGGAQRMAIGRQLEPFVAYDLAASGDLAGARAMIEPAPLDCYTCLRMRGKIAAAAHDWPTAARWFDAAVRQSPQIPFAYADWGEMLLAKGDLDGAVAKLALAHARGPHWADPSELSGEALMAKRDFKGAAARFAEADRHAPRWGRNHLLWGEALARLGKLDEAKAQWRAAAGMDLSVADRAELAGAQAAASKPIS